jgi:hypothetical protein
VPRPSSSTFQSPTRPNPPDTIEDLPKTPERKLSEVSAFSPWDSPAERRASARITRCKEAQLRKVATYSDLRCSCKDYSYTPTRKPLFPPRKSSLKPLLSGSPTSISPSSSSRSSTLTSESSHAESLDQSPRGTHRFPLKDAEHPARTTFSRLTKILDDLSHLIDNPLHLHLASPAILQLRSPTSLDELHISLLRRIFPAASKSQQQYLSTLAAILIAQSYLANLPLNLPLLPTSEPWLSSSPKPNYSTPLGLDLDLDLAAIFSSNESLNSHSIRAEAQELDKRAGVVEAALHVMLQKVMVRVCGRYDEVVWRAVRCLVEVVEG